ncbi:MAG TPA: MFS transporter [Candidatus Hydrogenedens sp.]|nr:MFS transporter [Candidatus Hydrogenedens sp.]HPP57607.1 MFS transporter [Candidatus Hydrogenedens sp.]
MLKKSTVSFSLLCLVGFLVDFAIMAGIVALPFLILEHIPSGNTALSGNVFAVQMATYTIACLIMSRIVGESKNILFWARWGVIIFTFAYPLFPFIPNKFTLYLCSIFSFIGMALSWPAFYAWVGTEPNEYKRQRNLAIFNMLWSLGFTMSPLISGPLYDFDYRAPFILVFCVSLFSFILLMIIPDASKYHPIPQEAEDTSRDKSVEMENNGIYLYPYWLGVFLANLMTIIPRSTYAEHLKQMVAQGELRFLFESIPSALLQTDPATKFSWPSAMMAFATAGIFLLFAWTQFWRYRLSILIVSQAVCALFFLLLSETKSIILICIAFAIIGANHGLTFFASTYYSVHNPKLRHRRASINEGLIGLGGVVGSLIFGSLVEKYGVRLSYKIIIFLIVLVIFIEIFIFDYLQKKAQYKYRDSACKSENK